jgi:antitoxin (DNA-binding transcriptional repressor) of toxin-antitoxin stability system
LKLAAVSEFKAKLASYLRLVKSGESVEITEHGVPIARISKLTANQSEKIISPVVSPSVLSNYKFSAHLKGDIDAVDLLLEDRSRR